MDDSTVTKTLEMLTRRLSVNPAFWRLEGSTNLYVQGVPVQPKDLDITCYMADIAAFRKAMSPQVVAEYFDNSKPAQMLICRLNQQKVELIGRDHSDPLAMEDKTIWTEWRRLRLPMLPLPYAKEFYQRIGRTEKVELIERYLTTRVQ